MTTAITPASPAATRQETVPGPVAPTPDAVCRLRPVPLGAVTITGGLWEARRQVNGDVAVPLGRERLEAAGNLDNLRIAAGTITGKPRGPVFMDSDVYKWLEAAAWEYARRPSDELLEAQREITAIIAAAQQPDGYLDSVVQLQQDGERYRELGRSHEHYCAGHLFQAAVAQVRCTGDRGLLDVAVRLADHRPRHDPQVVEVARRLQALAPERDGDVAVHLPAGLPEPAGDRDCSQWNRPQTAGGVPRRYDGAGDRLLAGSRRRRGRHGCGHDPSSNRGGSTSTSEGDGSRAECGGDATAWAEVAR